MHFAYPPRKSSDPPYPSKSSRLPSLRWARLRNILLIAASGIFFLFLLSRVWGISGDGIPTGTPPVVLVTTIDLKRNQALTDKVKENRRQYAAIQGYATFYANNTDYRLDGSPLSWSKVPAMRHAMTNFPHSTYFLFIDEDALVTNYAVDVVIDIMEKQRMEELMITNVPVVPPDSAIKTFAHLKGDRIDLVISQDKVGLAHGAFIMRRGEWAKYFLDAWFDPLYRSYNFQKAEQHALEHLVQWHGTILAKLALIPQNLINAYVDAIADKASSAGRARDGDFITNFGMCNRSPRDCLTEMRPYLEKADKQYKDMK